MIKLSISNYTTITYENENTRILILQILLETAINIYVKETAEIKEDRALEIWNSEMQRIEKEHKKERLRTRRNNRSQNTGHNHYRSNLYSADLQEKALCTKRLM